MSSPDPLPARLGPFRIGLQLGRGGMAAVHAAVHEPTGTLAAVKTLDVERDRATELHAEAALVAGLDHPAVVPVLDYGVVPDGVPGLVAGAPYLVMLRGTGTLSRLRGRLAWPELAHALRQVLEGLAHAHARGVLHCDVKPSNVLVGVRRDPRQPLAGPLAGLVLTDFGIGRRLGGGGAGMGGTPRYMAPEQEQRDLDAYGPWTDLYAVGALGWALATGAPPGPDASFRARQAVPVQLEPWLRRLLAPRPADRFQRASEALDAFPSGAPVKPVSGWRPVPLDAPTQVVSEPVVLEDPPEAARSSAVLPTHPVPSDWRPVAPVWPSPTLQGAGLGVWGLRPPPWVGREVERDALWAVLRDVAAVRAAEVVLVRGPGGVGRTRLLDWLRHRAHEVAGAEVVAPVATPWTPPLSAGALGVIAIDDAEAHPEVVDAIRDRLELDEVAPTATLIVAALCLDEEAPWPEPWRDLASQAHVVRVSALHDADAEELARRVLPLEPELVLRLSRESGGLPGVLVRRLASWIAGGRLTETGRGFRLQGEDGGPAAVVPVALELAAVFGPGFGLSVVPDLAVLDAALRTGRVRRTTDGLKLDPELQVALVAQAKAAGRLPEHHRACAEALLEATMPQQVLARGEHLLAAGDASGALPVLLEAADQLLLQGRFRAGAAAVQAAERAVERLQLPDDDRRRAELLALRLRMDTTAMAPGERARAAEVLDARAEASGWSDLRSEALARRAVTASNQGRPAEGRRLAERAVALADAGDFVSQQVAGRLYLGHMCLLLGDVAAADMAFAEILERAATHPVPAVAQVSGHVGRSILSRRTGDWRAAVLHAETALGVATRSGLWLDRAKALRALGAAHARSGHYGTAAGIWRRYIALARNVGLISDLPNAWTDLGEALRQEGQLAEAERAFQRAVAQMRDADHSDVIPRMNLARLYVDTKRFPEAWELVGPDGVEVTSIGWASLRPQVLALRAAAAAGLALRVEAEAALAAVAQEDPEVLRTDPGLEEVLALARAQCVAAGWHDLGLLSVDAAGLSTSGP